MSYQDWPIEARISHRIIVYVTKHGLNQFGIEEIIKEELSDAHNAALAAEQGRHLPYISDLERQLATERERPCAWCESEREEVLHQLAAEREKVKVANAQCKTIAALMQDAEQQLADYKQKAESMLATSKRVNAQLRSQLAAEVDAAFANAFPKKFNALAKPRSTRVKEGK